MAPPFFLGQKAEDEIEHLLVLHVQEMTSADIQGAAIDHGGAAQASGFRGFFQYQDFLQRGATIMQGVRQGQSAGAAANDEKFYFAHGMMDHGTAGGDALRKNRCRARRSKWKRASASAFFPTLWEAPV